MSPPTKFSGLKDLLWKVGSSMPDRKRVKGATTITVKVVPNDVLVGRSRLDTFEVTGTNRNKSNLEGKKVAIVFGREGHHLTRTFFVPKLAMIYRNITEKRDDVEFLFVSLDETKEQYDRFTKSMPWPVLPWEDKNIGSQLIKALHTPLKKDTGYGQQASVVIVDSDHETFLNTDAEYYISKTHETTGAEFPFRVSAAENCCAVATATMMCTIM